MNERILSSEMHLFQSKMFAFSYRLKSYLLKQKLSDKDIRAKATHTAPLLQLLQVIMQALIT